VLPDGKTNKVWLLSSSLRTRADLRSGDGVPGNRRYALHLPPPLHLRISKSPDIRADAGLGSNPIVLGISWIHSRRRRVTGSDG
jgi:hypothetical protein